MAAVGSEERGAGAFGPGDRCGAELVVLPEPESPASLAGPTYTIRFPSGEIATRLPDCVTGWSACSGGNASRARDARHKEITRYLRSIKE